MTLKVYLGKVIFHSPGLYGGSDTAINVDSRVLRKDQEALIATGISKETDSMSSKVLLKGLWLYVPFTTETQIFGFDGTNDVVLDKISSYNLRVLIVRIAYLNEHLVNMK